MLCLICNDTTKQIFNKEQFCINYCNKCTFAYSYNNDDWYSVVNEWSIFSRISMTYCKEYLKIEKMISDIVNVACNKDICFYFSVNAIKIFLYKKGLWKIDEIINYEEHYGVYITDYDDIINSTTTDFLSVELANNIYDDAIYNKLQYKYNILQNVFKNIINRYILLDYRVFILGEKDLFGFTLPEDSTFISLYKAINQNFLTEINEYPKKILIDIGNNNLSDFPFVLQTSFLIKDSGYYKVYTLNNSRNIMF